MGGFEASGGFEAGSNDMIAGRPRTPRDARPARFRDSATAVAETLETEPPEETRL